MLFTEAAFLIVSAKEWFLQILGVYKNEWEIYWKLFISQDWIFIFSIDTGKLWDDFVSYVVFNRLTVNSFNHQLLLLCLLLLPLLLLPLLSPPPLTTVTTPPPPPPLLNYFNYYYCFSTVTLQETKYPVWQAVVRDPNLTHKLLLSCRLPYHLSHGALPIESFQPPD